MSEDRAKVLQVRDLTVKFQTQKKLFTAVNRVSLAIGRGETLCLVGESGSGKTTLALAVVGLLNGAQVEGNVVIENRDIYSLDNRSIRELLRQRTSFIFQDPVGSLVPGISIGKQLIRVISYRLSIKDRERSEHRGRQLLRQVGLENTDHLWSLYPHQLSGGMCQRVMIAMALSVEPVLVIADEPISALDALTQEKILELLANLQKVHEFGMLFITHDMRIAAHYADSIAVMKAGEIVEHNRAGEFFRDPQTPYSVYLIESAKKLSISL